jgi:agmatine deiminase|tara:strand:+ start:735 stop:941 length:207 start_codon:yes stop_codon:yes gene_type:complete
MLVREEEIDLARKMVRSSKVHFEHCPFDDLWMRDTAPLFVLNEAGAKAAVGFNFNGWVESRPTASMQK